MTNRFLYDPATVSLLLIFSSAAVAEELPPGKMFSYQVEVSAERFADYPCEDMVGHAAKCWIKDPRGYLIVTSDCIDAAHKPVQCVQGIPQDRQVSHGRRYVTLNLPPDNFVPKPKLQLQDSETSITVTVEGDRRHVSAVDAEGNLLWRRDPFSDSGQDPYRIAVPRVYWIGELKDRLGRHCLHQSKDKRDVCIRLTYTSSQIEYLNLRTGEIYPGGRD